MVQSKNLTLSFSSESSIEEELKSESTADVITILISYLVMFAYISLTLGDSPRLSSFYISSKVLLGLSGVVLVMLSVLGSVGFFSAIGVKSTLIIMEASHPISCSSCVAHSGISDEKVAYREFGNWISIRRRTIEDRMIQEYRASSKMRFW
ncbi:uncharacterized protein LOC133728317 isoform X2 [Rosa rugosa]|uniref:uncharacterized protein LOC133728317 isoform X2 n=1 Tax=Rosa rugosa TaxID=74645 RepID=UPI002B4067FB|nr:uncharacterized protein LOC133728317 isoform X2 [Rosa rugosa]